MKGAKGDQGIAGRKGVKGEQGGVGPQGLPGQRGYQGIQVRFRLCAYCNILPSLFNSALL